MNRAAVLIAEQTPVVVPAFSALEMEKNPRSESARSYGSLMFRLLRCCQTALRTAALGPAPSVASPRRGVVACSLHLHLFSGR